MSIRSADSVLSLETIDKTYDGASKPALDRVSFSVAPGEFFSILGPSGSGKTTILRIIAGFETPDRGRVVMGGTMVNDTPPFRRDVRTVFQSYALFPHLTVRDNVAYPLRMQGEAKGPRRAKAEAALALVEMSPYAERLPHQLSGGQRQRVALARAVVSRPKILLLDEPLGALDLRLRQQMQHTLVQLQKELGIAFVYVTHDQGEALSMSNRVAVMRDGRIAQLATPREIYFEPRSEFVSQFVGRSNLVPIRFEPAGSDFVAVIEGTRLPAITSDRPGPARMALRFESVRISPRNGVAGPSSALPGIVEDILFLGTNCEVAVRCGELSLIGSIPAERDTTLAVGQPVHVDFDLTSTQVFRD
ncbi:ABC transporter ATP-binding protein [Mangrovicella endophytica]|uniref:ABC transporter ATP-binding protein n=1 Tax=Mangrovicella endophytica TaxID=2066697 RepID=UPI000C9E68F6|nr:ABC transporter ATP-binding protein [Mangrovicella endophytica]